MGSRRPSCDDDEFVQYSEPRHGVYKTIVIRDGKLVGATLVGDVSKVSFLTQAFDSGLPLPDERVSLMFDIGTPDVAVGVAELSDDAQVCNCNGVSKAALVELRARWRDVGHRRDGQDQGGQGLRVVQGAGRRRSSSGRRAARSTEDPSARWYVPGIPYDKPTLMRHIRELQLHSVSSVFAALAPDGKPGRRTRRWRWRHCWR